MSPKRIDIIIEDPTSKYPLKESFWGDPTLSTNPWIQHAFGLRTLASLGPQYILTWDRAQFVLGEKFSDEEERSAPHWKFGHRLSERRRPLGIMGEQLRDPSSNPSVQNYCNIRCVLGWPLIGPPWFRKWAAFFFFVNVEFLSEAWLASQ